LPSIPPSLAPMMSQAILNFKANQINVSSFNAPTYSPATGQITWANNYGNIVAANTAQLNQMTAISNLGSPANQAQASAIDFTSRAAVHALNSYILSPTAINTESYNNLINLVSYRSLQ
jgi:hypothetical protein